MKSFHQLLKISEKFVIDNSPTILTTIGVVGTVTTAVLTGRAAFELGYQAYANAHLCLNPDPLDRDVRDALKEHWTLFIPPVAVGALTCGAIIGANRIDTRRAAAVAAAYSVTEKAFAEYREKTEERLGRKQEQAMRDDIAQDRVNANPLGGREVIIAGGGDVLCYDEYTGRYFTSDMETLRRAQNTINQQIINDFYAPLADFYNEIGLAAASFSHEVGWNSDNLIDLNFSTTMSEDSKPCISVGFNVTPIRGFHRIH